MQEVPMQGRDPPVDGQTIVEQEESQGKARDSPSTGKAIQETEGGAIHKKQDEVGAPDQMVEPGSSNSQSDTMRFMLNSAQPLDPASFPNPAGKGRSTPVTIPNVEYLLTMHGMTPRYDVIKKKLRLVVPGYSGAPDNADNDAMAQVISLAALNGLSSGMVPTFVETLGNRNPINPVADWITGKSWDGVDRFQLMCAAFVQRDDFPEPLKKTLIRRWFISAVAAALGSKGFRTRGVLTLQGPQSIGKGEMIKSFVSDLVLRELVIKSDHYHDPGNKDTQISAICHWIVEIGELDSSFKKDVARLKGFLTNDRDKVRRPYARTESEYPRRTVFCATVNDSNFLVDSTGNTRFWTIPLIDVNYNHGIDTQQLFAQMAVEYHNGEQWWLTKEEERQLEQQNRRHRTISSIGERLTEIIDLDRLGEQKLPAMTATDLLLRIDIKDPTNGQCKECYSAMREILGDPKRSKGQNYWHVPLRTKRWTPEGADASDGDDDLY